MPVIFIMEATFPLNSAMIVASICMSQAIDKCKSTQVAKCHSESHIGDNLSKITIMTVFKIIIMNLPVL